MKVPSERSEIRKRSRQTVLTLSQINSLNKKNSGVRMYGIREVCAVIAQAS